MSQEIGRYNTNYGPVIWLRGGRVGDRGFVKPPRVNHPAQFRPLAEAPDIMLNLGQNIDPNWQRQEISNYVAANGPSDSELQAHILRYLKDVHGMEFDPKLNPHAPIPQYYS